MWGDTFLFFTEKRGRTENKNVKSDRKSYLLQNWQGIKYNMIEVF